MKSVHKKRRETKVSALYHPLFWLYVRIYGTQSCFKNAKPKASVKMVRQRSDTQFSNCLLIEVSSSGATALLPVSSKR